MSVARGRAGASEGHDDWHASLKAQGAAAPAPVGTKMVRDGAAVLGREGSGTGRAMVWDDSGTFGTSIEAWRSARCSKPELCRRCGSCARRGQGSSSRPRADKRAGAPVLGWAGATFEAVRHGWVGHLDVFFGKSGLPSLPGAATTVRDAALATSCEGARGQRGVAGGRLSSAGKRGTLGKAANRPGRPPVAIQKDALFVQISLKGCGKKSEGELEGADEESQSILASPRVHEIERFLRSISPPIPVPAPGSPL